MSLFLPVLLFGLVQPAQPSATPLRSQTVSPAQSQQLVDTSAQPSAAKGERDGGVCYTMRSYIFERRNGYAPELTGMTTCSPSKAVIQRHIRGKARLIPAN